MARKPNGFTLIELLVVITIIGILVGLLMPAVQAARESGRMTTCLNRYRQVALAMNAYHEANGTFPAGMEVWDSRWPSDKKPEGSQHQGFGWAAHILNFVEQKPLFDAIDFSGWYSSEQNRKYGGMTLELFLCPSDTQGGEMVGCCSGWQNGPDPLDDLGMTNMAAVADSDDWTYNGIAAKSLSDCNGITGNLYGAPSAIIRDGLSNTLLIGEVTGAGPGTHKAFMWATWNLLDTKDGINGPFTMPGGSWASDESSAGTYTGFRDTGFSSFHPGGCHFARADGSAQFFNETIPYHLLQALTTRDGGEAVNY